MLCTRVGSSGRWDCAGYIGPGLDSSNSCNSFGERECLSRE